MDQQNAWSGSALVECVPNFSEGTRPAVMDSIQQAVVDVPGVLLFDRHQDAIHNRMVLTFAGAPGAVAEAAFRSTERAHALIDMDLHRGVHPRIGATDVVPFIPLGATPMALCVDLARRLAWRIAAELDVPVYLYGEAAVRAERRRLPDLRRGEYEGLRQRILSDAAAAPDFGPSRMGAAGATAVGARTFLVAYNVTLATGHLSVARRIARLIRESSGGLPTVQARAFPTARPDVVQVSINIGDARVAPLHVVFRRIAEEADAAGVEVLESEVVGLLPTAVMAETTRHALRFPRLDASHALEARLLEVSLRGMPPG